MDLGEYYPCLRVANIHKSIEFYEKLGFKMIEDFREHNWAVLQHNNMVLSLMLLYFGISNLQLAD